MSLDKLMQESIINNLVDRTLASAYGEKPNSSIKKSFSGKSIRTMTQDLIMQFPLLISENISVKTVQILAEGFERENAILVKLLLMNDLGSLTNDLESGNVSTVLNKIHTNINASIFNENNMINENLKQLVPIENKFNQYSLNEGTLPKYITEASSSNTTSRTNSTDTTTFDDDGRLKERTTSRVTTDTSSERTLNFSNRSSFDPDLFKKINKLAPTFIEMDLHVSNSTSKEEENSSETAKNIRRVVGSKQTDKSTRDVKIVFGVKCVAHALKSDDIIHNISNSFTNSTLFKFIKWTTGEYSFAKGLGEIIFDFDRMKSLGIQASKSSNYWWFKLRKLKNANRSKYLSMSNRTMPTKTATLIITKEEVDYLATNYRIDLKQNKQAYKLLNDLFLLNFGFIDESTETVYLFDEVSRSYTVRELNDFKTKEKSKPLDIEDIKSLFGR